MLKILSFLALFFIVFSAYSQSISGTFSQLPMAKLRQHDVVLNHCH